MVMKQPLYRYIIVIRVMEKNLGTFGYMLVFNIILRSRY